MISGWKQVVPQASTIAAVCLIAAAAVTLEVVRLVLFRTLMLAEPVAKTATVAVMSALLAKVVEYSLRKAEPVRILRATGFLFACAGAFIGWLPAMMVFGRPAGANTAPIEFAFVVMAAAAGLVAFGTIGSRTWHRRRATHHAYFDRP